MPDTTPPGPSTNADDGTTLKQVTTMDLAVLAAIEKYKITATMLVPTMLYMLMDHPKLDDYDLSSLETIYYGAAAMSPTRLKEAIERFGQ